MSTPLIHILTLYKLFNYRYYHRVVVTGLGAVCPLGIGVKYVWKNLLQGKIGISYLDSSEYYNIPCQVAAFVPQGDNDGELNIEKKFKSSELRTISKSTAYALVAVEEALQDAKWCPKCDKDLEHTGVAVGTGMVDLADIINEGNKLQIKGYGKVSPHFVTRILSNMTAGQISIRHGFKGPNHSVSTACATGAHAIGDAFNFVKHGYASLMICGATDAIISPLSIASFSRIRALSTKFNSSPSEASRPFDKARDGFVMAEGAAILVLENLEHALERNAMIYAEILGYGLSGDAHHVAAPSADGKGAYLCMKSALEKGNVKPESVTYINAHATSTPLGDAAELKAIKNLFGDHTKKLLISSTKGATGHLLGAAGSLEAIFTVLAISTGNIPMTVNLKECEFASDFQIVSKQSVVLSECQQFRIGMTNSFGFGGTNASLLFSNFQR